MTFNKNISGKYYTSNNTDVLVYQYYGGEHFHGVGLGEKRTVALTGWQTTARDGDVMSQTTEGKYIAMSEGWQPTGQTVQYSRQQAQEMVNKIIANNKTIISNNLLCARFAHRLTSAQKQQLYELQERLSERNNSLINDGMATVQTTATPSGYVAFEKYLESFMLTGGIGSVTVAIVVAAIVIASLSTAAYFAYQYYYKESEQDVKFSNNLTKTLVSKLTDEEYAQLKAETQGMITKATLKARFGSNTKAWLVTAAALVAAGLIIKKSI